MIHAPINANAKYQKTYSIRVTRVKEPIMDWVRETGAIAHVDGMLYFINVLVNKYKKICLKCLTEAIVLSNLD